MDEAARTRLAAWLSAEAGAPVEITGMGLLSGGAVQQNWALDVTLGGAPQRWVLRTDNAAALAVSPPRTAEYAPLARRACRRCRGAGAAVLLHRARRHRRALLRHAAGGGHRRRPPAGPRRAGRRLGGRSRTRVGAIHAIVPPRADLPFLGEPPADAHIAFIVAQRAALDAAGTPRPVLEWGLRHLERMAPKPAATVLNHNDFRTGNYMALGDQVSAILDWEFAAWGDPHADLGWFCAPCWRFGALAQEGGGVGPRAAFYAGYEAASGRAVEHDRVLWWELAATIRWAVVAPDQAGRHLSGDTSLELALTGHIVPELEMDVLRMTGVA